MLFDDTLKASIDRSVLCWLATSHEGIPNVSPKEIFTNYSDNILLIANIASPNTERNIDQNPHICVSFVDVFLQKGFKLKGKAIIVKKNMLEYDELAVPLLSMLGDTFKIKNIIKMTVEHSTPILAPSYLFHPETLEQDQIKQAMNTYKVQPNTHFDD